MVSFPTVSDESSLLFGPVYLVSIAASGDLKRESAGVFDTPNARKKIVQIGTALSQRFCLNCPVCVTQAILDVNTPDARTVCGELFADDVSKPGTVSGIVIHLRIRV